MTVFHPVRAALGLLALLTMLSCANLHAAVLYVRYADADHPSGTVEQTDVGLYVGYISGFNVSPENEARPIDLPGWDRICRGALQLHLAAQARNRQETA